MRYSYFLSVFLILAGLLLIVIAFRGKAGKLVEAITAPQAGKK